MQGECNGKVGKRSFTALDTAKPKLILYKDNHKMEYSKVITQFFPLFPIYLPELPLRHFNMVVQRRQQQRCTSTGTPCTQTYLYLPPKKHVLPPKVETQNLASHEQAIAKLIHHKNTNIKHANKSCVSRATHRNSHTY